MIPIKEIRRFFAKQAHQKNTFLMSLPKLKEITEIGKGLANANYLLTFADGKKLISRFNFWKDKDWYTGNVISIKNEFQVLKSLENQDIAPKVYFVDTSKKVFPFEFLIEEYINHDGSKVDSDFAGVVETIKKLHKVKITGNVRKIFNIDADEKRKGLLYQQRLKSIESNRGSDIEKIFFEMKNVYKEYLGTVKNLLSGNSIIHHDPFPENFLHKNHWYLVDWQTTVIGNPMHDIAYLLMDFIYQFTLGRKLVDAEKVLILESYFGKNANITKIRRQAEKLLPIYYIDLFLFLLYKNAELKKQKFPRPLHAFLQKRLTLAINIVLKKEEILFWFGEMERTLKK